jgi:cytochrome c oxidase assembly factor CtaG
MRAVLKPWLVKGTAAAGVGSFALLFVLSPFGAYLQSTLALHLILEPFLYASAGFLFGYAVDSLMWVASKLSKGLSEAYGKFLENNSAFNRYGIVSFCFAAFLVGFWYYPDNFDATIMYPILQVPSHLSIIGAGALIYLSSILLTKRTKQFLPVVFGKGLGLLGAFMLVSPVPFYTAYPATEQLETGVTLILIMLALDMVLMPLLLYRYFGKDAKLR